MLAALSAPLKAANDLLTTKAGRKARRAPRVQRRVRHADANALHPPRRCCPLQAPGRVGALRALSAALRDALDVLGLSDGGAPSSELSALRAVALARADTTDAAIAAQIEARRAARAAGDYAAGDAIREALAAKGIALMDGAAGTEWRPAVPTEGA